MALRPLRPRPHSDRLWRLAVSSLDSFSAAVACRELRSSAGDLLKNRQALDATMPPPPAFGELRVVDLTPKTAKWTSIVEAAVPPVRDVFERGDGARLTLELPTAAPTVIESVITSFLRR